MAEEVDGDSIAAGLVNRSRYVIVEREQNVVKDALEAAKEFSEVAGKANGDLKALAKNDGNPAYVNDLFESLSQEHKESLAEPRTAKRFAEAVGGFAQYCRNLVSGIGQLSGVDDVEPSELSADDKLPIKTNGLSEAERDAVKSPILEILVTTRSNLQGMSSLAAEVDKTIKPFEKNEGMVADVEGEGLIGAVKKVHKLQSRYEDLLAAKEAAKE